jgi:hypothetical protein
VKSCDLRGHSGYSISGNRGRQGMNIVKGCLAAAVFVAMAASSAGAVAIGANGYYVETIANSIVTTSSLTAQALYNYSTPGAQFPALPSPVSFPYFGGGQAGTTDTTGLATSCFDQTTAVEHPDVIDYGPGPDYTAASYAGASLATGSVHASGQGVGYGVAQSEAIASDTLHFTIAGATGSTVTPITVHWKMDGSWSYNPNAWSGEVYGGLILGGTVRADMAGDNTHPLAFVTAYGRTGESGWASSSYASDTFTNIDFTGVYNLVGPSVDLPMYLSLFVNPAGGLYPDGYTAVGTTIDFSNTGAVTLDLPSNVSFTSDSGVFLTPEPMTLLLLGLGLGRLTLAGRRKNTA